MVDGAETLDNVLFCRYQKKWLVTKLLLADRLKCICNRSKDVYLCKVIGTSILANSCATELQQLDQPAAFFRFQSYQPPPPQQPPPVSETPTEISEAIRMLDER